MGCNGLQWIGFKRKDRNGLEYIELFRNIKYINGFKSIELFQNRDRNGLEEIGFYNSV